MCVRIIIVIVIIIIYLPHQFTLHLFHATLLVYLPVLSYHFPQNSQIINFFTSKWMKIDKLRKIKWLSSYIYKLQYSHIFRRTHNLTKQIWNEIWTFCKTNLLHFWFQTYLFNISCFFLHLIYDEILCGNVFIHMWYYLS